MTEHDVLVGFRLRLFTLAEELGNVSAACRAMGVDRSTYYRLKRKVDRWGLEALKVRERRRPRMPNEIGPHLEQRIVAFALGHPGSGRGGSRPSWRGRSGAASGSPSTASGACCAASGSTPARSAWRSSPATATATSASRPSPRAPHRRLRAGREGPARLLLRRPAVGHQGHRLAVHGDRRRLRLRLGRAQRPRSATPARATPASCCTASPRAQGRRLEAARGHHRQRLRVPPREFGRRRASRRPPALHQGRPARTPTAASSASN